MDKLPRFKFIPANSKEELLEQKAEINALQAKAVETNPECANGGCGDKCGSAECSKKLRGILNQIEKELRNAESDKS